MINVRAGSAAESAGLRGADREARVGNYRVPWGGDYIIAVDGAAISDSNKLSEALALKLAGDTVLLTVIRQGEELQLTVKLLPRDSGVRL